MNECCFTQRSGLPALTPWRVRIARDHARLRRLTAADAKSLNDDGSVVDQVVAAFGGALRGVVDVDGVARCAFAFRPRVEGLHWLPLDFAWLDVRHDDDDDDAQHDAGDTWRTDAAASRIALCGIGQ